MKLERINAAAQVELPKARPLSRSQSVSKISAPIPDRKSNAENTTTRIPLFGSRRKTACARGDGRSTFIVDHSRRNVRYNLGTGKCGDLLHGLERIESLNRAKNQYQSAWPHGPFIVATKLFLSHFCRSGIFR
jgi:hypothetical protein